MEIVEFKPSSGECGVCELRDNIWDIREAATHWRAEHPEELDRLADAIVLKQALEMGMAQRG